MKRIGRTTRREPAISLINIIFLILIFFMVAGTLDRPAPASIELVRTEGLESRAGAHVLNVDRKGALSVNGAPVDGLQAYLEAAPEGESIARVAPDRRLPARELIALVSQLRALGAERVVIVTETTP
ncbi:MAG: ExbD/TolR family protein [Oceanicaulis sp.]